MWQKIVRKEKQILRNLFFNVCWTTERLLNFYLPEKDVTAFIFSFSDFCCWFCSCLLKSADLTLIFTSIVIKEECFSIHNEMFPLLFYLFLYLIQLLFVIDAVPVLLKIIFFSTQYLMHKLQSKKYKDIIVAC